MFDILKSMNNSLPSWLTSSQNPDSVSHTVRGFVLMFSGIVLTIAQAKGWVYDASQYTFLATQLGAAAGSLWFLYGLVFKALVRIKPTLVTTPTQQP